MVSIGLQCPSYGCDTPAAPSTEKAVPTKVAVLARDRFVSSGGFRVARSATPSLPRIPLPSPGPNPGRSPRGANRSVGRGGANAPADVIRAVRWLTAQGFGPTDRSPSAVGDAIARFQEERLGLSPPDGRIDPRGLTETALRAGPWPKPRSPALMRRESRVLVVGDSLAVGMTPHFERLAAANGIALDGRAVEGSTTAHWANERGNGRFELADDLDAGLRSNPTHVLISLGTNDEYSGMSPARVRAEVSTLLDRIEAAGAQPLWLGAPDLPIDSRSTDTRAAIRDVLEERGYGAHFFPADQLDIPRTSDGIHPAGHGYRVSASAAWWFFAGDAR